MFFLGYDATDDQDVDGKIIEDAIVRTGSGFCRAWHCFV